MEDIQEAFETAFGRVMPEAFKRQCKHWITCGAEAEMITEAILWAAGAAAPSWNYAREIIESNMEQGIHTQWQMITHRKRRRANSR